MDGLVNRAGAIHAASGENVPITSWILCQGLAGLRTQALGLAEAAGLQPVEYELRAHAPWRFLPPDIWPLWAARHAAGTLPMPHPDILISCGGLAAAVALANRRKSCLVHVQHPRRSPGRFDLIVAAQHDRLTGANVILTRTALHRINDARLAAAAAAWGPHFAHLPRPLVAVLLGGSNGRFRFGVEEGEALGRQLASMIVQDKVGLAITPSRRTSPAVRAVIQERVATVGGWMWDMQGANPYFALLALADAIIVTIDSVSMVSEAVATHAPVLLAPLPGRSRRIGGFLEGLRATGRVRDFNGRCDIWPVTPLDDTPAAAFEMRRRLGF